MHFGRKIRFHLAAVLVCCAARAEAHHGMDGVTPGSFSDGLLSGLAHPVIGADHLAALVAVGVLAALVRRRFQLGASFTLASVGGVAAHAAGLPLGGFETWVAASVIGLAAVLAIHPSAGFANRMLPLGAAIVGALHGYAYGEAIIGAEATPLVAYVAGLTVVQLALVLVVAIAAGRLPNLSTGGPRWATAAAVGSVGAVFFVVSLS